MCVCVGDKTPLCSMYEASPCAVPNALHSCHRKVVRSVGPSIFLSLRTGKYIGYVFYIYTGKAKLWKRLN